MPAFGHLSKAQVNEIASTILSVGLHPSDFKDLSLIERHFTGTEQEAVRLEHPDGHYFDFAIGLSRDSWQSLPLHTRRLSPWNGGEHCAEYVPGQEAPKETVLHVPWHQIRDGHLIIWLRAVKGEVGGDDLWKTLREAKVRPNDLLAIEAGHIVPRDPARDDSPNNLVVLTEDEHRLFARGFRSVLAEVKHTQLETTAQLADLTARVQRLEEASKTVPKKFLQDLIISETVKHVVGAALKSEQAKTLWEIVKKLIGPVLFRLLGGDGDTPVLPPDGPTNV